MVLKRVYMQNAVFYALVFFLALWQAKIPNNASVLALWFLPLLYLVFLSIQLNHTRNDSLTVKIIHHVLFIAKFITVYLLAGLLEFQTLTISLLVYIGIILVISCTEFLLLKGKTQVSDIKGLVQYTMSKVTSDPEEVRANTKYQNETNLSIVSLAFMLGGVHALDIPSLDVRSILFNTAVLLLVIYLYRRLQIANKKTYHRILEHQLMNQKKLKRDTVISQILLHLSIIATIGIRIIEGPDTITFLLFIPILMNLMLIKLNRVLAQANLTEEEKKLMNID